MKINILLLSALTALAGCSTSQRYVIDTDYSLAKNILIAADVDRTKMYLKDTPYDKAKNTLAAEGHGKEIDKVVGVSLAGAQYGGLMSATPGISDALGGSIMLLQSLTKSSYEPVQNTGHIIWMPKSYANNADDAQQKIKKLLKKAYLSSLPEGYSYEEKTYTFKPTYADPEEHTSINIEGGICSKETKVCRLDYTFKEPIEDRLTPTWLKEGKAYFWAFGVDEPPAAVRITLADRGKPNFSSIVYKPFYTHQYLKTVSSKLPDWIYIYSPKTRDRKYPVVYNSGKTLYFIAPKKKNH